MVAIIIRLYTINGCTIKLQIISKLLISTADYVFFSEKLDYKLISFVTNFAALPKRVARQNFRQNPENAFTNSLLPTLP